MLELILGLVILYAVFRFFISLGFGIVKIAIGLAGVAIALVILPVAFALIIPLAIGVIAVSVILSIFKAIF